MLSSSLHNSNMFLNFVCDPMATIKVCQGDLGSMYYDQTFNFTIDNFWAFISLLEFKHENM
jgi:hypothetical protein